MPCTQKLIDFEAQPMTTAPRVSLGCLVATLIGVTAIAIEFRARIDLVWSSWLHVRRSVYGWFGRLDFSLFEPAVPPGLETWADFTVVVSGLSTAAVVAWLLVVAITERLPQSAGFGLASLAGLAEPRQHDRRVTERKDSHE